MKKYNLFMIQPIVLLLLILFLNMDLNAQIIISSGDFPSSVGTYIITENDTVDTVEVDVGLPGENQIWKFNQKYPAVLYRQLVVDAYETDYSQYFPESNMVSRYVGKLGNLIHSYYFDDTEGVFYLFQQKTIDRILMQGIGIDSAIVNFNQYGFKYFGHVEMKPNILVNKFPIQYNDSWESVSQFSIEVDTLLFGNRITLLAEVRDSIYSVVDGWGTIILPSSSFDCLRVKSYITLNEKLFINGEEFKSRTSRTINYNWLAKDYGIIAKIISRHDQSDENFSIAKQVSRLHLFNPQIELTVADTSGEPEEILDIPVYVSDLTDLNIKKIKMCVNCDTNLIKPLEILKSNTLTEHWHDPCFALNDSNFIVELSGETPLKDKGILLYLRVSVMPTTATDTTEICFSGLEVDETGPAFVLRAGKFIINVATELSNDGSKYSKLPRGFKLYSNYPNPFNSNTTITYQIQEPSEVNLEIYNSLGQVVSILVNRKQEIGIYQVKWNGCHSKNEHLPSGVYFYRLRAIAVNPPQNSYDLIQKMILLR